MGSIIWTSVWAFLLLELAVTFILVVPVPRPIRNKIARIIFRFHVGDGIGKGAWFIAAALTFSLVDCYKHVEHLLEKLNSMDDQDAITGLHHQHHHDKQKLYKAERNMYLAGFALTLLFVIRRITQLMQESVELEDECQRLTLSTRLASDDGPGGGIEMKDIKTKPADKKTD